MNPNWGTASGAAPTLWLPEMPHSMFLFAKAFCQRWVSAMMLMWLEYGICKSRYPFIIIYSQYFNEDRTIHRPKGVSQRGWEVSTNPRLIGQSSTPLITRSSTPDISNNPRHHWSPDPQHQISAAHPYHHWFPLPPSEGDQVNEKRNVQTLQLQS